MVVKWLHIVMIRFDNGKVYLDGVLCENGELLLLTLKDYSEGRCVEFDLKEMVL